MDGSRTELLHNTDLNQHVVLTLDYSTQILYWINGSTVHDPRWINLESSNVDGSNRTVVYNTSNNDPFFDLSFETLFAVNIKDIDFFSGAIYASSPYIARLMVNNISDTSRMYISNIVCDFNDNALNMKVISSQRQAQGMQTKIR